VALRRGAVARGAVQALDAGAQVSDLGIAVVQQAIEVEALAGARRLADVEIGADEQLVGDHLRRVLAHHALEDLPRRLGLPELEQAAPLRHQRREVAGVLLQPLVEHAERLVEAPLVTVLLGELEEDPRRRVGLPPAAQLRQAVGQRPVAHRGASRQARESRLRRISAEIGKVPAL
jgi:hypothetical protein